MTNTTVQGMWEEYLRCLEKAGAIVDQNSVEVCKANFYAGATAIIAVLDHNQFIAQCSFRFYQKFMEIRNELKNEAEQYTNTHTEQIQ